ncbi:MAG TPA: hypothetical protein VGI81_17085, partial [Tepidisphaeraceae bacterium]
MLLFDKNKAKTRSPLADPSLPQAGESATLAFWDQLNDILLLMLPPFAVFCVAVTEWVHYLSGNRPHPLILSGLFAVVS